MNGEDNVNDEIIDVRMPRKDYVVLRSIIEREKTYNWLLNWLRSGWVWVVVTSTILATTFWEQLKRIVS